MSRVLFLVFLVSGTMGQVVLNGICNLVQFEYVRNLNITQMFGDWHQISRIDNGIQTGDCSTFNIHGNTTHVRFNESEVVNKTTKVLQGEITASEELAGLYTLNIASPTKMAIEFVVQSVSYSGHAVLYSCEYLNVTHKLVYAWQYNRKHPLTSAEQSAVDTLMANNTDLLALNGSWRITNYDASVCGGAVVISAVPHILTILAFLFIGKEFV